MTLQLHPCAVGSLIDETGCLAPGQLIWRREACEDFWASGIEELARMSLDDATALEQGILGKRVNLCFGWAGHACEHEECDMTATTAETIGDDDKELAREHFQSRLVVLAVRW